MRIGEDQPRVITWRYVILVAGMETAIYPAVVRSDDGGRSELERMWSGLKRTHGKTLVSAELQRCENWEGIVKKGWHTIKRFSMPKSHSILP